MAKKSAGILLYRVRENEVQVFLVHPGGPFFAKKDVGAWSVPKGEFTDDEEPLKAAVREFLEETGSAVEGTFVALKPATLKSGKTVFAWAVEGDLDENNITSNSFLMEWPPKSGNRRQFPEVDKGGWFDIATASLKINPAQLIFIHELVQQLSV